MLVRIPNHVQRLWDAWNIRGLIILSLFLQSFLVLFAPLRKQRGGKWIIMIPLWIAYLLADWVATFTIGLMLPAAGSDILAFWAPFLLLHLGGPDTITSLSLEDNEFWIRHLLGLILQVGSTIYVILQSLPHNKLGLPAFLVLIAGVIKYFERNRAFYLASFDHFGNNWVSGYATPPFPVQFEYIYESWRGEDSTPSRRPIFAVVCALGATMSLLVGAIMSLLVGPPMSRRAESKPPVPIIVAVVCTLGAIKSLLVGPPMTKQEQNLIHYFMDEKGSYEMLRTIEIQLSLLYELLHTKLPVVDSKIGYIFRMVNFGCILGALVTFSALRREYYHNKLGEFDICLTYGLLIGALVLDLISICLLMCSDFIIFRQCLIREHYNECIERHRWSNLVPQLNIIDCHFKNKDGNYPNILADCLGISSLFETIRRIHLVSSKNFVEGEAWEFIFKTLQKSNTGVASSKIFGPSRILTSQSTDFAWTWKKFEHMDRLLIWHIATEICYQDGCSGNSRSKSPSTSTNGFDHRKICKLISDYMFYLLVMEPSMTVSSPNNLKIVFEEKDPDKKWKWPSYFEKGSKETFTKDLGKLLEEENEGDDLDLGMLKEDVDKLEAVQNEYIARFSRIDAARLLAKELLKYQPGGCPWELMGRFWVEIVCYAAINCQPIVHARQVSRGGQFLTLVWLLINYLGLGLTPPSMNPESIAVDEGIASGKRKAQSIEHIASVKREARSIEKLKHEDPNR